MREKGDNNERNARRRMQQTNGQLSIIVLFRDSSPGISISCCQKIMRKSVEEEHFSAA